MSTRPIPKNATWTDIEEANRRGMHVADLLAERNDPGPWDSPSYASDRVPDDDDLRDWNPHDGGQAARAARKARENDKTSGNPGNTRFCQELPEWKSFPLECIPGVCGEFIQQAADAIDVDPAMVALSTLGACAAAIGNSRRILAKKGYPEPPVLWLATIAESGSRKSPANDAPLRSIRKKEGEAIKSFNQAMSEWQGMMLEHKEDHKRWLKNKEGDPPQEPEKPICRRFTVSDTTTEALAARLLDNPRGLYLVNDELSGFFTRLNQYRAGGKGGDEAAFLSMFGAREWIQDRKTGDKPTIYIPKAALCIAGTIQPGILRKLLTSEHFESGMAARFLMAYPPSRINRWTEDEVSELTESGYSKMVDRLLSLDMPLHPVTGEPEPVCLPLTTPAKKLFVAFHDEQAQEQAVLEGDLSAAWSKLTGYSLRLALVVEHIAWASGNEWQAPTCISEDSMASGIKLAQWFSNETKRIYAILGMSALENDDRKLAEKIAAIGPVSARDLMRQFSKLFPTADHADDALRRLAKSGYGEWEPIQPSGPKGGRPPDRKFIPRRNVDKTSPNAGTAGFCHSDSEEDF